MRQLSLSASPHGQSGEVNFLPRPPSSFTTKDKGKGMPLLGGRELAEKLALTRPEV
jgi:hypothetical protein